MKKKPIIRFSQIKNVVLIIFLVVLSGAIGFRVGVQRSLPLIPRASAQTDLSLFWGVWQKLEERYLDSSVLDSEQMIYGAIKGMVESLGDPYTAYFSPQDNKVNKEDLNGEFGGVGIQLGYKDSVLAVVSPLENTPASRAGVKAGDLILKIIDESNNIDKDTEGISLPEAVKLIRGKEGSSVVLTLLRDEQSPFEVSLVRDRIVVPSLTSEWIEQGGKKIAYIHLLQFSEVMYAQWEDWVNEVLAQSNSSDFEGVILDLRNNPGGFLEASVYIASEFLSSGVIVEQKGADEYNQVYRVGRQGNLLDTPLVVLVNRGSASASEILAGALKYYKRGKVIGQQTFGKGTVQEPDEFPDGSGLHVTIARWLLPSGDNIHKQGIEPDIKVEAGENSSEDEDEILQKGIEVLLSKDSQ
ncbi:MAG: S41 family peptidase [Candidatus Shapirobacteria bacterium]